MSTRNTKRKATEEPEHHDEEVARGEQIDVISPTLSTAIENASSPASSSSSSAMATPVTHAPTSALSAAFARKGGKSSARAAPDRKNPAGSPLAPNSGGQRRRITKMYTTIVYDPETSLLLGVFVTNAYDRARFLTGELDYLGGTESDRMVKFPMKLFYTNARNAR